MFFSLKIDRTRGHEVKLVKDQQACNSFMDPQSRLVTCVKRVNPLRFWGDGVGGG